MFAFALVIFAIFLFNSLTNAQVSCNEAYSCNNTKILASGDAVDCYGFYSCAKTRITTNREINCWGSYSCYNSDVLYATTNGYAIYCHGVFSCAFVSNLTSHGRVNCESESSCQGTNLYVPDSNDVIDCGGARSCENATLFIGFHLDADGYLAMKNAKIYSVDSSVSLTFQGAFSGDGAEVICGNGHTCSISCHINGCNNLTLTCAAGNGTCTFDISCTEDAEESDVCNRVTKTNFTLPRIEDVEDVIWSDYNNSYVTCAPGNVGVNCGDSQECYQDNSPLTNNVNGSLCCSGYQGCYDTYNLTTINNNIVRCDGKEACTRSDGYVFNRASGETKDSVDIGENYIYFTGYNGGDEMRYIWGGTANNYYANLLCSAHHV